MRRRKDPNAWFQQALKVADDPAVSDWLKKSLFEAINRDPVDAATDAEVLRSILSLRAEAVQHSIERPPSGRPAKPGD